MRVLLFSIFLLSGCTTVSKESANHNRGYVDGFKLKIAASLSLSEVKIKCVMFIIRAFGKVDLRTVMV